MHRHMLRLKNDEFHKWMGSKKPMEPIHANNATALPPAHNLTELPMQPSVENLY